MDPELSASQKLVDIIKRNKVLFFLLLVFIVLRIPSLFEPHRYADEEIYLTLGQGLRKGLVFYRDIHDNKPPFLYLVAAIAQNLFWFRFILLLVHALGVIIFWRLAKLVFEKNQKAVYISTFIFGLFSTLPTLEGNIANGENFMIVLALLGTYILYGSIKKPEKFNYLKNFFLIGFLFSIGFLFKIPIAFDFAGVLLFYWLLVIPSFNLKTIIRKAFSIKLWLMIGGFIIPIIISIIYYSWMGAFEPYVRSALLQNIGYLSSWSDGGGGMLANPLVWRGMIILAVFLLVYIFSAKLNLKSRFLIVWSVFSLYGAFLSNRPYPHYLLEPLVPMSLLVVFIIVEHSLISRLFSLMVIVLAISAYINIDFWYYETFSYYNNFINYSVGKKSWEEYIDFWDAKRNYDVASYIKPRTDPADQLFVWGTEPAIYTLTDLLPVGRYTVAYHVVDFNAYDQTMIELQTTFPKYIIDVDNAPEFEELKNFLANYYILETNIDGVRIYRKADNNKMLKF